MADQRHQVFVSSTFDDLRQARQQVLSALLQMNCIPAGMEFFPAANDEQWEFIKKVIDDCDYYIVIVAGRYGSTTAEGVSFTEKEFDYALSQQIPTLAFLHRDPDSIPLGQSELDPQLREHLAQFRNKLSSGRLVNFWSNGDELAARVVLSLNAALKSHPRPGWVRGGGPAAIDLLQEINQLRQQKEALERQLHEARMAVQAPALDLAPGTSSIEIKGRYKVRYNSSWQAWSQVVTWNGIIAAIGPNLLEWKNEGKISGDLARSLLRLRGTDFFEAETDKEIFKTIKVQFLATAVMDIQSLSTTDGGTGTFWQLTEKGKAILIQERTIKKSTAST